VVDVVTIDVPAALARLPLEDYNIGDPLPPTERGFNTRNTKSLDNDIRIEPTSDATNNSSNSFSFTFDSLLNPQQRITSFAAVSPTVQSTPSTNCSSSVFVGATNVAADDTTSSSTASHSLDTNAPSAAPQQAIAQTTTASNGLIPYVSSQFYVADFCPSTPNLAPVTREIPFGKGFDTRSSSYLSSDI